MPANLAGEASATAVLAARSRFILRRIGHIPPEPTPLTLGFVKNIVKRENVYILIIFVRKIFMFAMISEKQLHKTRSSTNIVINPSMNFHRMRSPHSRVVTKTQPALVVAACGSHPSSFSGFRLLIP